MEIIPSVMLCLTLMIGPIVSNKDINSSLSEWLWKTTEKTRMEALQTGLVTGVTNATLDPVSFGLYYLQDVAYIFDSADAFDIAAMRTFDRNLRRFLIKEAKDSRSYGKGLYATLPITDVLAIKFGPQFHGYANHLLTVALDEPAIYTALAIIPCRRLWPWIGAKINETSHNYGSYTKWVSENFDPTYDGYKKFEDIVDAGLDRGLINRNKALQIYSKSMNFEVLCFNLVN